MKNLLISLFLLTFLFSLSVSAAQFARPVSDVLNQWAITPSPVLWSNVDEAVPNNSDYIRTYFASGITAAEMKLSSVLTPSLTTNHILRISALQDNSNGTNTLTYELRQGTTVIATGPVQMSVWSQTSKLPIINNITIPSANISSITNYSDLSIKLIGNALAGRIYVYWIEFEVPNEAADTTPPTITNVQSSPSGNSAIITWITNEISNSSVLYGTTPLFGSSTGIINFIFSHLINLVGLSPSQTYFYQIISCDSFGNCASSQIENFTTLTPDTTQPVVYISSPAQDSVVSGTIQLSANASDDVSVAGVQFQVDGINAGSEITTSPYTTSLDTLALLNGNHSLGAVARDTSNNPAASSTVNIIVNNTFVPSLGPVVDFRFDEGKNQIFTDSSGNLVTGFLGSTNKSETTDPAWTNGIENGSLYFDASNDFATIAQNPALNISGPLTVEAWIYPNRTSTQTLINVKNKYSFLVQNTNKIRLTDNFGTYVESSANVLTLNKWNHVVGIFNGTPGNNLTLNNSFIYVNGVSKATTAFGKWTPGTMGGINVGRSVGGSSYFMGRIDEIRIYDRALSQSEVQNNYNSFVNDTISPQARISLPTENSTVSNKINITAFVSDNLGVMGARFFIDGISIGKEDIYSPFGISFDTTILADGPHVLTVEVRDWNSNNITSVPVTVNVDNTNQRKNVILILTDDQRWDTVPYMPYLNSILGNESVKFSNAFISTPTCCPSRAAILTGLYSHNNEVMQNTAPSGGATVFKDASTLATWLNSAGYRTGLYGKYLNGYNLLGTYIPPGWTEWHGGVTNTYYGYDVIENGIIVHYNSSEQNYHAVNFGAKVVQFIQSTPANQPFFVMYTPVSPHSTSHNSAQPPVIIPPPVLTQDVGKFNSFPAWRPPSYNETNVSDKPLFIQNITSFTNSQASNGDNVARRQLEAVLPVDRAIRDFVNVLNATGRLNNTIIIFMSDNGLLWGEHRLIDSKELPYEESIRVPMWVWIQGQTGRTEDDLISNIDLAPTIADFANVNPASAVNGMSFVPLLENSSVPWRSEVLIELIGSDALGGKGVPLSRDWSGVRTTQYKYVEYATGEKELYDLQNDPYELNNQINNLAYSSEISNLSVILNTLKAS